MENRRAITRARCPQFKARVDWRGRWYIQCGETFWRFESREARESQYRTHCCGSCEPCATHKEEEDTMTMLAETGTSRALTLADYEARIYLYKEQVGAGFIGIGRTLIEAKEAKVVPHGEWEAWVTRTTGMQPRDAQRCMQAAREIKDGSALARLEMTKALMLLGSGLQEEDREAMAKKAAEEGATVRELRRAIREKQEEVDLMAQKAREYSEDADRHCKRANDALAAAEGMQSALREVTEENEELRGQLGSVQEYLDAEREKIARQARDEMVELNRMAMEAKNREIDELQEELDAADAREEKRAAELEALRSERQQRAMEEARGITATPLGSLDLAMAVRSFLGTAGVLPQMAASIRQMSDEQREAIRQNVETVAVWVDGARAVLGHVAEADGYVV